MDIIGVAPWALQEIFLFWVCPTSRNFPPARCAADTNTVCSDFHIAQEPYPYPYNQMSSVDTADLQEREV